MKNFQDEELPHEVFTTTSPKTDIRNAFAKNMSTDIKVSKDQIIKIIQSGEFPVKTLGNLGKKYCYTLLIFWELN